MPILFFFKTQSIIFIKMAWHGVKLARPLYTVQVNIKFSTEYFIKKVIVVHWAQSQTPFQSTR